MGSNYKLVSETLLPKRKYKEEEEEEPLDSKDDILAFGYQVKLYNDKLTALKVDQGKYMIPLRSDDSNKLLMSRYDVRHLLEEKQQFVVMEKAVLDSEFDKERYEDLECYDREEEEIEEEKKERKREQEQEEEEEEEEEMHNVNKKQKLNDKSVHESPVQRDIIATFKTPENMIVPSSKDQVDIIQSTAKIVTNAKSSNLAEIKIQARQATNPLYSFLNRKDPLHSFYKHILWISSTGLGDYGDSSSSDDEDDTNDASNDSLPIPDDNINEVILKTAQFVAKSGDALEQHIKAKRMGDPKFDFLNPQNRFHAYYKSKVNFYRISK